ncbi:MAG: CsgG/HfaB family protein [bacterium]
MEKIPVGLQFIPLPKKTCVIPEKICRIAIMELQNLTQENGAGDKISGLLCSEIVKISRYSLTERRQLEKAMNEIALWMTGVIKDDQIIQAGNLLGAQAVIVGEITNYIRRVEYIPYEYESQGAGLLPLPPEEQVGIIVPSEKHKYMIEKYFCAIGFNLRMIDIKTGNVLWAKEVSRSFSAKEGEYNIHNVDYIMDKLVKSSVEEAVWELK